MNIKIMFNAVLFMSTIQVYGAVTEKLSKNAAKIESLKKDTKSGNLKPMRCGSNCRGGCQKCRSCNVIACK